MEINFGNTVFGPKHLLHEGDAHSLAPLFPLYGLPSLSSNHKRGCEHGMSESTDFFFFL